MAEAKLDQPQGAALEADQFASLLQKEFKPKTDRARAEVENAVLTLAEQALREAPSFPTTSSVRSRRSLPKSIASSPTKSI